MALVVTELQLGVFTRTFHDERNFWNQIGTISNIAPLAPPPSSPPSSPASPAIEELPASC